MATERFATLAEGTLLAPINSGAVSLQLQSIGNFPTSPQYRIRIDNELILVGAVSGTTLSTLTRGIEGTTAASHSAGAAVVLVWTAGSFGGQSDAASATPSIRTLDQSNSGSAASNTALQAEIARAEAEEVVLAAEQALLAAQKFYPETYGAAGGGANDVSHVQACINASSAANGVTVITQPFTCNSQLLLPANTAILFENPNAALLKNWATAGGSTQAFLVSGDGTLTTKANNIRIMGPGTIGATSLSMTGGLMAIYGDYFISKDYFLDTWTGGRAMVGAGNKWRGLAVTARNSGGFVGDGGWRYAGGTDSTFVAFDINSGDDSLQFVPLPTGQVMGNLDIGRCWYIGCTGSSVSARFLAMSLQNSGTLNGTFGGMTNNIYESGWAQCHGVGSNRSLYICNRDSTGIIDNIGVIDCSCDCANSTSFVISNCSAVNGSSTINNCDTTQLQSGMQVAGTGIPGATYVGTILSQTSFTMVQSDGVTLVNFTGSTTSTLTITFSAIAQAAAVNRMVALYSSVGKIQRIRMKNFEVKNPASSKNTLGFLGGEIDDVVLEDCILPNSSGSSFATLDMSSVTNGEIRGGVIDGGGNTAMTMVVRLGGAASSSASLAMRGTRITGIANGVLGFQVNGCASAEVTGVTLVPYAGATTAKTWQVTANGSAVNIHDNDFTQMPSNPSWANAATDTIAYNNRGDNTYLPFDMRTQSIAAAVALARGSAEIVLTDTTSGGFTLNLPATPQKGDRFWIIDSTGQWNTHNLTLGRNGNNIDGAASNLTLANQYGKVYVYFDGTQWWSLANGLNNSITPVVEGVAAVGTSNTAARADHVHPAAAAVAVTSITNRWFYLSGIKSTIALTSSTVSKMWAVRVPTWMWGRTCTGLALNYTVAAVLGAGTAVSATLRMALANDSSGQPSTSIISGTEVSWDMTQTAQAANGTFTGVVIPNNGWCVGVIETPTGTPSLGTLGTYPTWDIVNSTLEAFSGSTSPSTAGTANNEYTESGQTTFTGTLAGMTMPAMSNVAANAPRVQFKLT